MPDFTARICRRRALGVAGGVAGFAAAAPRLASAAILPPAIVAAPPSSGGWLRPEHGLAGSADLADFAGGVERQQRRNPGDRLRTHRPGADQAKSILIDRARRRYCSFPDCTPTDRSGAANERPAGLRQTSRILSENGSGAIWGAISADLDRAADRHFDEFQLNLHGSRNARSATDAAVTAIRVQINGAPVADDVPPRLSRRR